MPRNLSVLASLAVIGSAIVAGSAPATLGCSSGGGSSGSSSGSGSHSGSTTGTSGSGGTPSFANDVMPAFAMGCTLTAECHGQQGNMAEASLYLGFNPDDDSGTNTPAVISMVYQELMGMAVEDPQVALVAPGHPENSYLIQKLNGTQNASALASACMMASNPCSSYSANCTAATPCGAQMPYSGTPWSQDNMAALTAVTSWIMDGAKNN